MRVDQEELRIDIPRRLFEWPTLSVDCDVFGDGEAFLFSERSEGDGGPVTVVLNWWALLE